MMVIKIRKMVEAGCRVKILIADWFACMQNKFDGDLTKIRSIGFYMIEIWKAVGLELNTVEFIWLSDEINSHSAEYWALVMDISRNNTLRTMIRYFYVYAFPLFISFTKPYEYYFIRSFVGKHKLSCLRSRCCGILDPYILNEEDRIVGSYDHEDVVASTLFTPCVQCACILFQKVGYSIVICSSYVVNFSNICTISGFLELHFSQLRKGWL
jgi:hypothetical protein